MSTATFSIWRGDVRRRQVRRLHNRDRRRNGCAGRSPPNPGRSGQRPRAAMELQGRQMRLVLG